ncbi:GNAT family N-acetyltransferase [Luteimonas sp. 8-5]|uniref:GNAT family N-acetyltransferase n=1 Tax=Luteimonas sp. 8-5 TaxID=3039387 RepID=UPI002436F4E7|nr:GNAT family N-acetyltransferase [Luteimonas sp. 8-5]MDG6349147.1 GNAT family N-acetyltransferase [Luteimonas sp. 8-5]
MRLSIRHAVDSDIAFCEAVSRGNMAHYHATRGVEWSRKRFQTTWGEFENYMLLANDEMVGVLRLLANNDALDIRDLQVLPAWQNQGIGSWAIAWTRADAVRRGFPRVGLRVFVDNPALLLYERLGFETRTVDEHGKVHMTSPAA